MPDNTGNDGALKPDEGVVIPRMRVSEVGYTGLKIRNKSIYEEQQTAFRYPYFIHTVNEMRNNPTVGAAMNVYKFMMNRVKWSVQPPVNATEIDKKRASMVNTMLDDMEDMTWADFISDVVSYLEYGFSVHEIVLRRRLKKNGSKFNDGLVGVRKIAPRSQETVAGWVFDESGNNLQAIQQSVKFLNDPDKYVNRVNEEGYIILPIEKVLLFSASKTKGNPEGNSLYKNIYLAYKQLTLLQEQQLLSIAKDVQGILKIEIPPKYLDPNAEPEDVAVMLAFQKIIDNYNSGTQRGLLVPNIIDPESKLPLFSYDLLESKGSPKNDTESIIRGLQADILTALSVDILRLGADGSGSFSLAEAKTSILALAVDYRLREIKNILNSKLLRVIYEQNGWETTNLPSFTYEETEEVDLETFSKAIQRIFSTSAVEVDRPVMNRIRKMIGVPLKPEDEAVSKDDLPGNIAGVKSRSGDGMAVGTSGSGTGKDPFGGGDKSTSNNEN